MENVCIIITNTNKTKIDRNTFQYSGKRYPEKRIGIVQVRKGVRNNDYKVRYGK